MTKGTAKRNTTRAALAGAALTLCACATSTEMRLAEQRLNGMENLAALQAKEAKEQAAKADGARKELDAAIRKATAETTGIRKLVADLQADLDNAKLEATKGSGLYEDLAARIAKQEEALGSLDKESRQGVAEMKAQCAQELEQRVSAIKSELAAFAAQLAKLQHPESPAEMLARGDRALKENNAKEAAEIYGEFLKKFPTHSDALQARLKMGDALLQDGKTEEAVLAWQEIVKLAPPAKETPAALLRQGKAFLKLHDEASARYLLKRIASEFPATPEASEADKLLPGGKKNVTR